MIISIRNVSNNININNIIDYCGPIIILQNDRSNSDTGNELKLYDDDFIELFGQSIPNMILKRLYTKCVECKTVLSIQSSSKTIALSCHCCYCYDCLINKIATLLTNRKDTISKVKIENCLLKSFLNCNCGASIEFSQIIPLLLRDSSKLLTQFRDSITSVMVKHCFICTKITKNRKFKISSNRYSSVTYSHVVCNKCQKKSQENVNSINNCIFCDQYHPFPFFDFKEEEKHFCNVNCCILI